MANLMDEGDRIQNRLLPASTSTGLVNPSPRVLVIDDDPTLQDYVRLSLEPYGFHFIEASDGGQGLHRTRVDLPDVVLLDAGLPDLDGFDVLAQLRQWSRVPVILLTGRGEPSEKVHGLELGADDYLTKPFNLEELAARIKAVLRRSVWGGAPLSSVVVDDRLQVDLEEREVIVDGERISLRPTEYRLLYQLILHSGRTLPFEMLLACVWGREYRHETQYVHLYVTYLRQKIEPDPSHPRYILTKRGVGYRFQPIPACGQNRTGSPAGGTSWQGSSAA